MSLVPVHIQRLIAYKSGKPIDEVKREFGLNHVVKLASNENPSGPSPAALEAVAASLGRTHRYPDTSGFELRSLLADRFRLKIDNVVLGAGSEGIMSTIMRTFLSGPDEIISAQNSFIGFRVLANASGMKTHWVPMNGNRYDLPAMADLINEDTKIIYLANPDNPTGSFFTIEEFDTFMNHVPQRVLVILDEAYFEFAEAVPDYPDSMHYRYDNVITLRTFSKIYGLAGFRVGYGFAHPELIQNLMKVKLPFEPSVPAQVAAVAALKDSHYLEKSLDLNQTGKDRFVNYLNDRQIQFIPSVTNFVTMVFPDPGFAESVTEALLRRGVIVRHLIGFGWPACIRVTIGTDVEMDYFTYQFDEILTQVNLGV